MHLKTNNVLSKNLSNHPKYHNCYNLYPIINEIAKKIAVDVVFCVESELVVLFYSISTVKKKVEVSQNVAYFDVIYDYQDIFFDSDCKA